MQKRQTDRRLYFRELAATSEKYFLPYLSRFIKPEKGMEILEIGCGEGGNLLPFAKLGCNVTGVDLAANKIEDATRFFAEEQAEGLFIASDIFKITEFENSFDLIICHDVIEHISDKEGFMDNIRRYLKPEGIVFMAFPAWQMPFGGHQQICRNRLLSHMPFIHLLPAKAYRTLLETAGEDAGQIRELLEIKQTRTPVEVFEKLLRSHKAEVLDRQLWLINPHYEVKFGLRPRKLPRTIGKLPWVRNFFSTSCFYIFRFAQGLPCGFPATRTNPCPATVPPSLKAD